jgi:hypothetical protein
MHEAVGLALDAVGEDRLDGNSGGVGAIAVGDGSEDD